MPNNKYNQNRNLAPLRPTHNQRRLGEWKKGLVAGAVIGSLVTGSGAVIHNNFVESTKPLDASCTMTVGQGETVWNQVAVPIAEKTDQPIDAVMYDLKRTKGNDVMGREFPGGMVSVPEKYQAVAPNCEINK